MSAPADAPEPLIRARAMSELLAHLDEFEPGLLARVRARVPATDLAVIDGGLPTDWIAAPHTRKVIDGVVAELGARAPDLWCSLVGVRLFRSPLLRGFVDTIVRLGGMSPARFIKALPRGWNNAYKHWGEVHVTSRGANQAEVGFVGVNPYLFEHRQHWIAIEGVLRGLVAAGHGEGLVDFEFDHPAGRVLARVRW